MGTLRYTEGKVTVTLGGELEAFVRRALEAAGGETLRLMEQAAQEVATRAEAEWYAPGGGVHRETGQSGKMGVVTTVKPGEVRVSVGSTDKRSEGKGRKQGGNATPFVYYLKSPAPLAVDARKVSRVEYFEWRKAGKPVGPFGTSGASVDWVIYEPSDHASTGRSMVVELIRRPMKLKVKAITPELGRAIRAGMVR